VTGDAGGPQTRAPAPTGNGRGSSFAESTPSPWDAPSLVASATLGGKGELRAARLLRCGPRLPLAARPIIQTRLAKTGATADHGGKQRRPIRLDRGYQPIDYRVPLQGERESGDHCLCRLECKYLLRERPHESTPATLTRRPNGSALPGDVLAQGPAETDLPQPRTHSQAAPRPAIGSAAVASTS